MMARKTKRVLLVSDFHCGNNVGLTPSVNQVWDEVDQHDRRAKAAKLQAECWNWYIKNVRALGHIDVLIANGDLIDGSGDRSGGTEQITTDRIKQAEMAVECIEVAKADKIVITYGTAYHTGCAEDFERIVSTDSNIRNRVASIGSHEWVDVNGLIFDCKHHLGSSSVPHGRHTAIAKDRLWNLLWAERDQQPKAHVYIRSHVHYHQFTGGPDWLAMTLPALQAAGTKYGARRCSGTVDYGFVTFDVHPSRSYSWQAHLANLVHQRARVTTV